jgi:hypothetical protein
LKKFRVKFNTDDHDDTIKTKSNTLITWGKNERSNSWKIWNT